MSDLLQRVPEGYHAQYEHHRKHRFPNADRMDGGRRVLSERGGATRCEIYDGDPRDPGYNLVASGLARCSDEDNYCKVTGRRIALGRALRDLYATRLTELEWRPFRDETGKELWRRIDRWDRFRTFREALADEGIS